MSLDNFHKANRDLRNADEARTSMLRTLLAFQAACLAGEEDRLEETREEAHAHMDAYLDNLAVAHRAMRRM